MGAVVSVRAFCMLPAIVAFGFIIDRFVTQPKQVALLSARARSPFQPKPQQMAFRSHSMFGYCGSAISLSRILGSCTGMAQYRRTG